MEKRIIFLFSFMNEVVFHVLQDHFCILTSWNLQFIATHFSTQSLYLYEMKFDYKNVLFLHLVRSIT